MESTEKKVRPRLLDFERRRLDAPLYKENPDPHGFGMNPNDGLPGPAVSTTIAETTAADLTSERFVCMAGEGRDPCKHYKRQLLPSNDKEHTICLRYCTAIRDENEQFTDLGNQEILACDFRDPPDILSTKRIDVFDDEIVRRQVQRREEEKPFDPLAELENQEDE